MTSNTSPGCTSTGGDVNVSNVAETSSGCADSWSRGRGPRPGCANSTAALTAAVVMLTEMAAPKNSASPCVRAIPRPVHPIRQSAPVTRHCALHSRYVPLARCDDWHASPHALDRPRPALKPHKKKRTGLWSTRSTHGLPVSTTRARVDERLDPLTHPLRTHQKRLSNSAHTLGAPHTLRDSRTTHPRANALCADLSGHLRDGHARCIFVVSHATVAQLRVWRRQVR